MSEDTEDQQGRAELDSMAAELAAARRKVDGVIGPLASRPLVEDAVMEIRERLASPDLAAARETLAQHALARPRLRLVPRPNSTTPGEER